MDMTREQWEQFLQTYSGLGHLFSLLGYFGTPEEGETYRKKYPQVVAAYETWGIPEYIKERLPNPISYRSLNPEDSEFSEAESDITNQDTLVNYSETDIQFLTSIGISLIERG